MSTALPPMYALRRKSTGALLGTMSATGYHAGKKDGITTERIDVTIESAIKVTDSMSFGGYFVHAELRKAAAVKVRGAWDHWERIILDEQIPQADLEVVRLPDLSAVDLADGGEVEAMIGYLDDEDFTKAFDAVERERYAALRRPA